MPTAFLDHPGRPGALGAILDETARAAEDFCRVVESLSPAQFDEVRPAADPNTVSLRALCAHTVGAAHRYADYIRKARGLPFVDIYQLDPQQLAGPADVRPRLGVAFRYTEAALEGLYGASEAEIARVTFPVRWGPTYDPEMILEHGIVHLLRHRRQIERWVRGV
ncbi:MAG: DinB family protein [bacterium]|jgi:uncharacterized damage-inducible protein DinB|nr:DinB family protein [bacterium]